MLWKKKRGTICPIFPGSAERIGGKRLSLWLCGIGKEDVFVMVLDKFMGGSTDRWQRDSLVFEGIEPLIVDRGMPYLVVVDHDAVVVVNGDQTLIKRSVVEGIEQQTVRCSGFLGRS